MPHVHVYTKIVISQYSSFNYRDVVYECRCGCRKEFRVHHDRVFPFPTASLLTQKEFQAILDGQEKTLPIFPFLTSSGYIATTTPVHQL